MSELSPEILATIAALQAQLLTIINQAAVVEFLLIESVGEDSEAIESYESLASIIEMASDTYSRLVNLQLRISRFQPGIPVAMMQMLAQTIERGQMSLLSV